MAWEYGTEPHLKNCRGGYDVYQRVNENLPVFFCKVFCRVKISLDVQDNMAQRSRVVDFDETGIKLDNSRG